jgi:sulfur carrier protein ThiS adenylyltransferase
MEQLYKLKIEKAKIGIAGAGGLGSNCAMALVRAGFVNFNIADFDVVSQSNLNRQFYFANQIGQKKIQALGENLLKINPELNLSLFAEKITGENMEKIFGDVDVIVEAFDLPQEKAMITSRFLLDEKYYVCSSGIAGYGNSDRFVVRAIGKNSWIIGDGVSEVENLMPFAPGVLVCAAKQADKVLDIVLNLL